MKRFKVLLFFLISFLLLSTNESFSSPNSPINSATDRAIEVKGLVLKYVLIDTSYELYQVNAQKLSIFSEQSYKCLGEDVRKHYVWLQSTYDMFNDEMKNYVKIIFESGVHPWQMMNVTTTLKDDASVDDIIKALNSSLRLHFKKDTKIAIEKFFKYFYTGFLKDYIAVNNKVYQCYADSFNEQLVESKIDLLDFMEQASGISFNSKYKPLFYYTLRPIGAMGFNYKNTKVSTLQRNCKNFDDLLRVPFHEFSHELFQTFTYNSRFKDVTEILKKDKAFQEAWHNGMDKSYDWIGWCEENAVEGFAKFLEYKYYGVCKSSSIYVFDYSFYKYLKDVKFDPKDMSLEDACINFYKNTVKTNSKN